MAQKSSTQTEIRGSAEHRAHYPDSFKTERSRRYYEEIIKVIPGGVDSPFRSFCAVGGHAVFFSSASGSRLTDIDGNSYIDYLGAWGPAILGHSPAEVVEACQRVMAKGPVFGAPHELELEMARSVIGIVPSLEKIRFVNSGTEAVMSAIRLARGFTGRNLVVMFEGCYHGHSDPTLASEEHRSSAGVPDGTAKNTVRAVYNDVDSLRQVLSAHKDQVACVIIEPVCGSMGSVIPDSGYLKEVRQLCTEFGALLIFDEVLTGLRVALGGAQEYFDVKADLTTFGKALGGGLPIGAFGGRSEVMDRLLPEGDVYQAGTFSGNPVTMAGGIETIKLLSRPGVYETLEARTAQLFAALQEIIDKRSLPVQLQRAGSMFGIVFAPRPVRNYQDSLLIDEPAFAKFFHYCLSHGVYMPPSGTDAACVSYAHSEQDIEETVKVMADALAVSF